MTERWKIIPGFNDRYEVSDLARVRAVAALKRWVHWVSGKEGMRLTPEKILSTQVQNCGYEIVHLCIDGKRKACTVHRLVAAAFCEGFFADADVNHKDGVKTNNIATNLEWGTRLYNILHAVEMRLNKQAIPVIDPKTGIKYDSIAQAAKKAKHNARYIREYFTKLDDLTADLV